MSVLTRSHRLTRLGVGSLALLGLGVMSLQPASAQTRTLASLADVPAYVPAPYHPHVASASYGYSAYDGVYFASGGARYWH